jgi:hypothetical protein
MNEDNNGTNKKSELISRIKTGAILGFIAVPLLYAILVLIIVFAPCYYNPDDPKGVTYSFTYQADTIKISPDNSYMIPAIVNESGYPVFSEYELYSLANCRDPDSFDGTRFKAAEIFTIRYEPSALGTMIAIRPVRPMNATIDIRWQKSYIPEKGITLSSMQKTGFLPFMPADSAIIYLDDSIPVGTRPQVMLTFDCCGAYWSGCCKNWNGTIAGTADSENQEFVSVEMAESQRYQF